jgi:hypothetical protein
VVFLCSVNHEYVFTHWDLQRQNNKIKNGAVIDSPQTVTAKEENHSMIIIDRVFTAWYPSYSEYAFATHPGSRWINDCHRLACFFVLDAKTTIILSLGNGSLVIRNY